jgi:hypothetical protein
MLSTFGVSCGRWNGSEGGTGGTSHLATARHHSCTGACCSRGRGVCLHATTVCTRGAVLASQRVSVVFASEKQTVRTAQHCMHPCTAPMGMQTAGGTAALLVLRAGKHSTTSDQWTTWSTATCN